MQDKISVIIPTYSPENYIEKNIESLKSQTLSKNKYEVLILLNGRKEPYYNFIKEKIEKENNFEIIYIEKSNVSNARNQGILKSKGNYILFLDDDDFISDNFLEEVYKLRQNRSIIISNLIAFKDEDGLIVEDYLTKFFLKNISVKSRNKLKMRKSLSNACGKLIDKKIILGTKFDEKLKKSEDSLFMLNISKDIDYFITTKEDVIYYRRVRKNSVSRKKEDKKNELKNNFYLVGKYISFLKKEKYSKILILTRILASFKNLLNQLLNRSY